MVGSDFGCRVRTALRPYEHEAIDLQDRIRRDRIALGRAVPAVAGPQVETGPVPRTLETPIHHIAARERKVTMGTAILDGVYLVVQAHHADASSVDQCDGQWCVTWHLVRARDALPGAGLGGARVVAHDTVTQC